MNSEAFVSEILKKHGDILDLSTSLVKVDSLAVLTAYMKAVLPGFRSVNIISKKYIKLKVIQIIIYF